MLVLVVSFSKYFYAVCGCISAYSQEGSVCSDSNVAALANAPKYYTILFANSTENESMHWLRWLPLCLHIRTVDLHLMGLRGRASQLQGLGGPAHKQTVLA